MSLTPGKLYCQNIFKYPSNGYRSNNIEIYEMVSEDFAIVENLDPRNLIEQRYKPVWIFDFWEYHNPSDVLLLYTGELKSRANICYHQFLFGEKVVWVKDSELTKLMQVNGK